jgi:hypothetical protein
MYSFVTTLWKANALELVSPSSLADGRAYESSAFAYYGPQTDVHLRAPGVVIEKLALCNPDPKSIKGKIVIIGEWWPTLSSFWDCGATQSLGDVYEAMNRTGAIALVFVSHLDFFPVGSLKYHYETWDRCRFCDASMVLVHVSTDALAMIDEWRRQPELEFLLHTKIADHASRSLFFGMWWTLCFRVLLPSIAFITFLKQY